MPKIFKKQQEVNNHVKRNNFDLSFQNHLTMKMGTLYPVFCKEVVPGDSFRINSAFGLKFMPLSFPVQSKMRAELKFFYVRNKNLWNKWENWVSNLEGAEQDVYHPYIFQPDSFFETGKLADYLNIPTTIAVQGSANIVESCYQEVNALEGVSSFNSSNPNNGTGIAASRMYFLYESKLADGYTFDRAIAPVTSYSCIGSIYGFTSRMLNPAGGTISFPIHPDTNAIDSANLYVLVRDAGQTDNAYWDVRTGGLTMRKNSDSVSYTYNASFATWWNNHIGIGKEMAFLPVVIETKYSFSVFQDYYFDVHYTADFAVESVTGNDFLTPFSEEADQLVRVSALPFRAYESIYNAYYRNTVNQKFIVDGQEVYNRYNTTLEGGADYTPYHLFQRNYELDFLTSALPSPQQGNAPLVGFNVLTGRYELSDEDGITEFEVTVGTGDNAGSTGLNVTSPIASKQHALTLAELGTVGMSINDLRSTNSLQKWLEVNIRKGYRYIDFIAGHFGKSPEYKELDMPEFIGGYSRDVNVSQILSTADTLGLGNDGGKGLGSFNGTANCFGGSNHSITHYCDDYGFIMGILCVVPTPAYSQLLPKHFLKSNPLDYYFPEFSSLGYSPITYEEVCPVQAYRDYSNDGTKLLTDTFGYQRPNYDLVSSVDEIHGQFRGDLRNCLINRVFGSRPVLGDDFLQIKPEDTDNIFVESSSNGDNIVGQVVFDVKAKRPVPRVVIPSLER